MVKNAFASCGASVEKYSKMVSMREGWSSRAGCRNGDLDGLGGQLQRPITTTREAGQGDRWEAAHFLLGTVQSKRAIIWTQLCLDSSFFCLGIVKCSEFLFLDRGFRSVEHEIFQSYLYYTGSCFLFRGWAWCPVLLFASRTNRASLTLQRQGVRLRVP